MRSLLVGLSLLGAMAHVARANPDGLVPQPGGVFAHLDYDYEVDRASIEREHVGDGVAANGPVPLEKDLVFHQYQHTITPKIEIGVLGDAWIYGALPIVITQSRELKLDSGIDSSSSSTIADGILPASGYDAQAPTTPPGGGMAFRGVDRHGVDQLHVGIGVAPMNQAQDDTKPTWKIGAEMRIAIGKVMRFDPSAPGDNTAVGSGVHELRVWTSFDRRMGWAEPWVEMFWQAPIATTSASLFQDPGFGSTNVQKQQLAGVNFGFEAYAVDDKVEHNRISLDLGAHAVAHFEGRDYSEMWEVFSYAGSTANPMNPLILDADPTMDGVQAVSHPGITNIENYLETGARAAIRAELGTHVRFAVTGDTIWKTDHIISFADAGVDKNGNDLVDAGTNEINPLHVDKIDLVGHRYHAVDGFAFVLGVQALVLF